jgi:hypothetical protein
MMKLLVRDPNRTYSPLELAVIEATNNRRAVAKFRSAIISAVLPAVRGTPLHDYLDAMLRMTTADRIAGKPWNRHSQCAEPSPVP